MTTLLIDALIALVKLIDRGLTAVEKNVRLRATPPGPVVDAQPAGAGDFASATGPGGHPLDRPTSDVLTEARYQLACIYTQDRRPAVVRELMTELSDRAAQFRAVND